MNKKALILILVAIVLVLIGYVFMKQRAVAPVPAPNQAETRTGTEPSFSWRFVTTESEDGLPPSTQVSLIANGDVYDAGSYAGSCAEIAEENLLVGEVSAVLCWWAGGGDEIGVFRDEDLNYFLLRGVQEEGTAESEGFRGDFKEIAVIR